MTDILDELVHQFADPYAFYRELVQNGIDAGSSRIEVVLAYQPGEGMATAAVTDWGEGMNRDVIERYLLTKFRSSKDGDLTKIGKFGIGFLSVFAPGPELVAVDTGCDGEDWRLLLHPDKTYELRRCPQPVEGTKVTLFLRRGPAEYRELVARSEQSVRRWCRHSEADVRFAAGGDDGSPAPAPAPVREPLVVDAPFQVEHREEGTVIVAGPARTLPAVGGFYNRGLTLLETEEDLVPRVTFKIVSRYLEHTLTRDNVKRDRGFEKAMKLVRRLCEGPLLERLPQAIADARTDGDRAVLLGYAHGRLSPDKLLFPLATGGTIDGKSLRRAARKAGAVYHAPAGDPIARALGGDVPVVADGDCQSLACGVAERPPERVDDAFVLAEIDEEAAPLAARVRDMLVRAGGRVDRVAVGQLTGAAAEVPLLLVDGPGVLPAAKARATPWGRRPPPLAILNRRNPWVGAALELAPRSVDLAALLLCRLIAASTGALDDALDRALTEAGLA